MATNFTFEIFNSDCLFFITQLRPVLNTANVIGKFVKVLVGLPVEISLHSQNTQHFPRSLKLSYQKRSDPVESTSTAVA